MNNSLQWPKSKRYSSSPLPANDEPRNKTGRAGQELSDDFCPGEAKVEDCLKGGLGKNRFLLNKFAPRTFDKAASRQTGRLRILNTQRAKLQHDRTDSE